MVRCILCEAFINLREGRFERHMKQEHEMYSNNMELILSIHFLTEPERVRLNERMQERKEKAREVISQDMDMPPLLPPPPRELVANFPGIETKPEEDVKVIDLANEEATEEEKVKNMWS